MEQILGLIIGLWLFVVAWWIWSKVFPILEELIGILYEVILWILRFIRKLIRAPRDSAESDDATPTT